MELLTAQEIQNIKNIIELGSTSLTSEVEVSFIPSKAKLTLTNYIVLLKSLVKKAKQEKLKIEKTTTLDVNYSYDYETFNNYRITLLNLTTINNIISTMSLRENHVIFSLLTKKILDGSTDLEIMNKKKSKEHIIDIIDMPLRFRLADEVMVDKNNLIDLQHVNHAEKNNITFRLKERLSVFNVENDNYIIRTDLTTVRTSNNLNKIESAYKTYELEVEIKFKKTNNGKLLSSIENNLFNEITYLLKILQKSNILIGNKESVQVIDDMKTLTKSTLNDLPAMQSVSAELIHIIDNIPNKYSVTDKADGERSFLFIHNNNVYIISNTLEIKKINNNEYNQKKIEEYNNTIIDGEYISLVKENKYLFLGFDILFFKNQDVRETSSLIERYKLINQLNQDIFDQEIIPQNYQGPFDLDKILKFYEKNLFQYMKFINTSIKKNKMNIIATKYFIFPIGGHPCEIYAYSNLIWKLYTTNIDFNCPYHLDGLIYTPLEQKYTLEKIINRTFKWKPASLNSIDFYVQFEKNKDTDLPVIAYDNSYDNILTDKTLENDNAEEVDIKVKNKMYNILSLYVGKYRNGKETPELFQKEERNYIAHIYLERGEPRDIEGNIIQDGTVVEFSYNNNPLMEKPFRWIPLRTRYDKTDMVIKYKRKYGNSDFTANRVWQSIIDAVETGDIELLGKIETYDKHLIELKKRITGQTIGKLREEDAYYQYQNKLVKTMGQFNNFIKSNLIYTYCNQNYIEKNVTKKLNILDYGCGRGGDIQKFYHTRKGINFYVGFDIDQYGIYSSSDSIISRYNEFKRKLPNYPDMEFLVADGSSKLNFEDQIKSITKIPDVSKPLIKKYFGETPDSKDHVKFDIFNIQFVIHYLFKNDITLDNFCDNINKYLNKDGFILITVFDGDIIHNSFNKQDRITGYYTSKEGKRDVLFDIVKKYPSDIKSLNQTGLAIDIQMSWINNNYITEYIVTPSFITETLHKKANMNLVDTGSFAELYEKYRDFFENYVKYEQSESYKILNNVAKFYDLTDESIACSYEYMKLNKYYVFQKY